MAGMLKRIDLLAGRVRVNRAEGETAPNKWDQETFNATRDAFLALAKALNGGGDKAAVAGLLEGILHEHRHLQSKAIWALLQALGAFGGLSNKTDGRNVHAHAACKDIRETLGERIYWPDFAA